MGNSNKDFGKLTKAELESMEERHFKFFCKEFGTKGDAYVSSSQVANIKALKNNPFKKTLVELFCSDEEGNAMNFNDFLEMCSVFSPKANKEAKVLTAYLLFTSSSKDNLMRKSDVENVIGRLVGDQMKTSAKANEEKDINSISGAAECVMKEADLDSSGEISYNEFKRICNQMVDFEDCYSFVVLRSDDKGELGEVFGKDLRLRVEKERIIYQDPSIMVPTIVKYLIDFIRKVIPRLGIFREVGSALTCKNYRIKINDHAEKPLDFSSIFKQDLTSNDASSLLKSYFRFLPECVVTFNGYDRLVVIGQRDEVDEKTQITKLKTMVEALPTINYETLKYLMELLHYISLETKYSMDSNNLAICLNPSLCFPRMKESTESFFNTKFIISSLSTMIKHFPIIFGVEPIENYTSRIELSSNFNFSKKDKIIEDSSSDTEIDKIKKSNFDLKDSITKEIERLESKLSMKELNDREESKRQSMLRITEEELGNNEKTDNLLNNDTMNEQKIGELKDGTVELQLRKSINDSKARRSKHRYSTKSDPNDEFLQTIQKLQKENHELKRQQEEIYIILEKITEHERRDVDVSEQLTTLKSVTEREVQQLRKYIYNSEEQTIDELKSIWTKISNMDEKVKKKEISSSDSLSQNAAIHALKEDIKSVRNEIRNMYSGFVEVSERVKTIEGNQIELTAKIDQVLKEQRFQKVKIDYDIEHLKRIIEENNSKTKQLNLDFTSLKSRVEARLNYNTIRSTPSNYSTSPTKSPSQSSKTFF
ncbi:hypothetical protein ABK040_001841 [Willaertia magna]